MKKANNISIFKNKCATVLAGLLFFLAFSATAQELPKPSPHSEVEQMVGLTTVSVDYSRPSAKGRTIFGDLVPFGKTWRTGANANTKVTFSSDVTVDGQTLKAGSYGLYTVPS